MRAMGTTYTEPTINNIHLPAPIARASAGYNMHNYRDHLTSEDRAGLNETNLHPYCF